MLVVQATPQTSTRVLRQHINELTAKQTALLRQKASSNSATRKQGGEQLLIRAPQRQQLLMCGQRNNTAPNVPASAVRAIVEEQLSRLIAMSPPLRNLLTSDPRATKQYNEMFAALGGPATMRLPLPFCRQVTGAEKYAYCTGSSMPSVFSVPAGTKAIVINDPVQYAQPMRFGYTGAGGDNWQITANDFDQDASLTSHPTGGLFGGSSWRNGFAPFQPYTDANAVKSAALGTMKVPTNEIHPPLIQVLSCSMNFAVDVPYTGQCVVYPFSPGLDKDRLGTAGVHTRYDVQANHSIADNFIGGHYAPHYANDAAATPEEFARALGAMPIVCVGGAQSAHQDGVVRAAPMHDWVYAGVLDAVDDTGNTFSSIHNMQPRLNPSVLHSNGWLVIDNTGNTTVDITCYNTSTYAVLLHPSNLDTGMARLVGLERLAANQLTPHVSGKADITIGPVVATTKNAVKLAIRNELRSEGVPEVALRHDQHEAQNVKTTSGTSFKNEATHVVQGTLATDLALAVSTGKGLFSRGKAFVKGLFSEGTAGGGASAGGEAASTSTAGEIAEVVGSSLIV